MKILALVMIAAVSTIAGAGCERPDHSTGKVSSGSHLINPKITIVRGCLTGSGDQFILTNLEHSAPTSGVAEQPSTAEPISATESYQLIGQEDRLRALVGQRVELVGDSEPAQIVDFVSATPANAPDRGTTGTSGSDAKVSTASRARVEIHNLKVSSVNPLGD